MSGWRGVGWRVRSPVRAGLWALLPLLVLLLVSAGRAEEDPFAWRWYEVDDRNQVHVNLFVFYRDSCPHCREGLAFVDRLRQRHDWLKVRKYETSRHAGNLELYRRMSASLQRRAGTVPAFFYCRQMTIGFSSEATTGRGIESGLQQCHEHLQKQLDERTGLDERTAQGGLSYRVGGRSNPDTGPAGGRPPEAGQFPAHGSGAPAPASPNLAVMLALPLVGAVEQSQPLELDLPAPAADEINAETVEVPLLGELRAGDMSLPALTLILAGCDAFNPCAFFVLLSLLSLLMHARSRGRMLLVGGIFVLFSGLFYFLFMAAWLNVFLLAGNLPVITLVAGGLAVTVSLINIKDYFAFQRGVTLSIPARAKPRLFDRMRKLVSAVSLWPMLLGTLALAVAANSYELLCTAGFPMVFTRVLTLRELSTLNYYGYLGLYNLIYVIPLAAIVLAFTWTLGSRKLQQHEGRILKLLSGVMMLLLGLVILCQPELLQSVWTAVLLLLGSLTATALVVLVDGWWHHGFPARN